MKLDLPVVLDPVAYEDLDDIKRFYLLKSEVAANRIVSDILDNIDSLNVFPQKFPVLADIKKDVRKVTVRKYFLVLYTIESDHILVHRVFDQRQNPDTLKLP